MSEPKPLSKEQRAEIENWLTPSGGGFRVAREARFVRELLADSQWWRKAVKTAEFYAACPFCDGRMPKAPTRDIRAIEHWPGCPFTLAQE